MRKSPQNGSAVPGVVNVPRKGISAKGLASPFLNQHEHTIIGMTRKNREIDATRHGCGAKWVGPAGAHAEFFIDMCWIGIDPVHGYLAFLLTDNLESQLQRVLDGEVTQKAGHGHGFFQFIG